MTFASDSQPQQTALSTRSARPLTTEVKTPPQMAGITPRWLLRLLPWVQVEGGVFRVNRRQMVSPDSGIPANPEGEKSIDILSDHEGESHLPETFVDYEDNPREYSLSIVQTVLKIHTRVSDLYTDPFDPFKEQLRLTVEGLMERKESEIINNDGQGDPDRAFGLLNMVAPSMRVQTRNGRATPDDLDELLSRVWKKPCFFLAHPRAIAAFGRECTRRGVPPATANMLASPFLTWRGVPIVPSDKIKVKSAGNAETTSILLMRVGEQEAGVVGLHKAGIPNEVSPSVSVRLMGVDQKAVASYLVTLYFSVAALVPDALGVLENVSVSHYYDYDN